MHYKPEVSVIITTYNRKGYLKQALDSIKLQINANFEIIIIDDNSSDGTEKMISNEYNEDYITYIKNKYNKGPEYGRTLGIEKSRGNYIVFFDDDDFYVKNNVFEKAIMKFKEQPNLVFVTFNANIFNEKVGDTINSSLGFNGYIDGYNYLGNFQWKMKKPLSTFTTLFSKEKMFPNQNSINDNYINDSSIYLHALLNGDVYVFTDIVGNYRVHDSNITNTLNVEFILKNLESKKRISKKILVSKSKQESWLYKQVDLTLKYFLLNSSYSFNDLKLIIQWTNSFSLKKMISIRFKILLYFIWNFK